MINTELFQKIHELITTEPESFNMDAWEDRWAHYATEQCHTTRCVAGWAIYETTGKHLFEADGSTLHESVIDLAGSYGINPSQESGKIIAVAAAKVLGLEIEDEDVLFHMDADVAHDVVEAFSLGQNDLAFDLLNDEHPVIEPDEYIY